MHCLLNISFSLLFFFFSSSPLPFWRNKSCSTYPCKIHCLHVYIYIYYELFIRRPLLADCVFPVTPFFFMVAQTAVVYRKTYRCLCLCVFSGTHFMPFALMSLFCAIWTLCICTHTYTHTYVYAHPHPYPYTCCPPHTHSCKRTHLHSYTFTCT